MKKLLLALVIAALMGVQTAAAAPIYASSIVEGSTKHNWGPGCHGPLDASVILGAPDNKLTGWGGGDASYVVLGFDQVFTDGAGDDLIIHGFGPGPTHLYVAMENYDTIGEWTFLGELGTSRPRQMSQWGYDFADFNGLASAKYVLLNSGSGKFIDAVEAVHVSQTPVPGALWLLGSGLAGLAGFRRKG